MVFAVLVVVSQKLGRRIKTRFTPRLRFHYDKSTAHGNYMADLISKAVKDLPAEDSYGIDETATEQK